MQGRHCEVGAAALRRGFSLTAVPLEEEENLTLGVVNSEVCGQNQECTEAARMEAAQNQSGALSLVHHVQAV